MAQEILELRNISKTYDNGVVANEDISLKFKKAEIHAIMGENGAGKSTLMNIIFGEIQPSHGDILLNNQKVDIKSPAHAIDLGIGMVHQHFKLVESLNIAQNIYLGIEPKKGVFIDVDKMIEQARELASIYNFKIDVRKKVRDISVGEKQKVEILKALARGAKILILDEPTAVLTPQETNELFEELISYKENGHTIIFISHKLNEVKQISDRISIIRKGKSIGTYDTKDISESEISRLMVGRDVVKHFDKLKLNTTDVVLDVDKVSYTNEFKKQVLNQVSMSIRGGEIVGIAGVEGNGQSELINCICGLYPNYSGDIKVNKQSTKNKNISQIRKLGLSHVSDDRISQGVALDATISENLIATKLDKTSLKQFGLFNDRKVRLFSENLIQQFVVKCDSSYEQVRMLSGGNMQKVVVAREFSDNPVIVIANQPTRGVDVGSAEFIYKIMLEMRDKGAGILMVSSDLNEIMELSDRILVMHNGTINGYFSEPKKLTEEELGYYMLGVKNQSENEQEVSNLE